MKKGFVFEIKDSDWNYVEEKGLPEDGAWCFFIWQTGGDEYEYAVGGYHADKNTFYVNFGFGGCVFEAEGVVAWVPMFNGEDKFLKIMD